MKNLIITTGIALASTLLIAHTTLAQGNEISDNEQFEINCSGPNGNTIEGTPMWESFTGKIITKSVCPTNAKVGIQVDNPQANLHISSRLKKIEEGPLLIIENADEKVLQLSNSGVLNAREIRVNLDQWPDYVFKNDYRLISIDSLKSFIDTKGHLPNIPSAKVIESEGLNLGESNKLLMEKVEELTLYLIAQDKEQKSIKASLKQQQKLLNAQQELLLKQTLIIEKISNNLK